MNDKVHKSLWFGAVIIFLVFCAAVCWFVGVPMIRLAKQPDAFRQWVNQFGIGGRFLFIAMVTIQVIVALIPGEPLELAAGYAFGALEGTVLSLIGILIGSWLVFSLVRRFGVKLVSVFFSDREIKRLSFLRNPQKTKMIAFLLMLIPGTPKDLLSYFAGLTPLSLRQWLSIVAVARIPSLVSSTITGAAAGEERYVFALLMLLLTVFISGAGVFYYRNLCREQAQKESAENSSDECRAG